MNLRYWITDGTTYVVDAPELPEISIGAEVDGGRVTMIDYIYGQYATGSELYPLPARFLQLANGNVLNVVSRRGDVLESFQGTPVH